MADQLARAEDFEKKAEKKLSGWGLFGSKFKDAADLFDKAANSFQLTKSCTTCLSMDTTMTRMAEMQRRRRLS
ncbi:unnamed protein product [Trifolium pratense]|uniref:Uncharacterized protein n=1 Tax=Trifolium pratense TaxID=57577 RepID=A0ACB0K6W6_TRIPR|nr:unnamed protein product [Trifolium pratense]